MILNLPVDVDTSKLVEYLDQETAEQLIKLIDISMADLDFTTRLAKHFIKEIKK